MTKFGHTPEADRGARAEVLPARMRSTVARAYEDLTMVRPWLQADEQAADRTRRLTLARRHIIQACAIGLAAIDRLTYEIEQGNTDET